MMLTLIIGCKIQFNKTSVQSLESNNDRVDAEHKEGIAYDKVNWKYGDITDPVELEKLWQEYFYDTIWSIGNMSGFDSAEEIDPLDIARFCIDKYNMEYGYDGYEKMELKSENSSSRLLPLDIVLEYAKWYFNLTSLDVTEISDGYYDPEKQSFFFGFSDNQKRRTYNDPKNIMNLDTVIRNNDGTITAVLVEYDHPPKTDRIVSTMTYTLKKREDGSMYFVSGKRNYINNHLVTITGDYQRFDRITGLDERNMLYDLTMIDEVNDKLIMLYNTSYSGIKNAALMLIDINTMSVVKKLELNNEISSSDVSLKGENILIRLNDSFLSVDKTLEKIESFPLPKVITDKINREQKDNDKRIFFGGYDVSLDRKRYVYADETGVKLFNTIENSEKLLSKTVPITDCELIDNSYHVNPRFVDDEQKVITTMSGYELSMGYTLCDLKNGTVRSYDIGSEASSTGNIRYDSGLMEINNFIFNEDGETGDYKTMYLGFKTGEVQELYLEDSGDVRIVMPDQRYVGRSFAAFITVKPDSNDNTNNIYYLNRLNLTTMQIEPKVITVKAARTYILGVLADGRIVFWYSLNPSEEGICITK